MLSQYFSPHIVLAMWCRQSTLEEFHTLFNIKLKKETEMQKMLEAICYFHHDIMLLKP